MDIQLRHCVTSMRCRRLLFHVSARSLLFFVPRSSFFVFPSSDLCLACSWLNLGARTNQCHHTTYLPIWKPKRHTTICDNGERPHRHTCSGTETETHHCHSINYQTSRPLNYLNNHTVAQSHRRTVARSVCCCRYPTIGILWCLQTRRGTVAQSRDHTVTRLHGHSISAKQP